MLYTYKFTNIVYSIVYTYTLANGVYWILYAYILTNGVYSIVYTYIDRRRVFYLIMLMYIDKRYVFASCGLTYWIKCQESGQFVLCLFHHTSMLWPFVSTTLSAMILCNKNIKEKMFVLKSYWRGRLQSKLSCLYETIHGFVWVESSTDLAWKRPG